MISRVPTISWIGLALSGTLLGSLTGCVSSRGPVDPAASAPLSPPPYAAAAPPLAPAPPVRANAEVVPASAILSSPPPSAFRRVPSGWPSAFAADPFAGQAEVSVERLVAEVEARNPSLEAARAAWRAAAERYPQVIAWDDPMFGFTVSPGGVGLEQGGGWMVEASQKVPWAGKQALRGAAASAEADAAGDEVADARLQLALAAKMALADYYQAAREADVNRITASLLSEFRQIAKNKYEVRQATEQDVLQADVDLADLESRRAEIERNRRVAVARINTLLHRAADYPLPPPPAQVAIADALPEVEALRQSAVECRPDLSAQLARIRREEANLELAAKDYCPDVELVAKYDAFMPVDIRPQVGMNVNVPLARGRREAAVREAAARVAQQRAEYQDRLDQVRYEVQSAHDRLLQQRQVIALYAQRILPASQQSLQSARANYVAGKLDFLRLIDAERQFHSQRERYYEALADYQRRQADLERAAGQPLPAAAAPGR